MKINKSLGLLTIVIVVSFSLYTGSIFLGYAHEKQTVSAIIGDTVLGSFRARFGESLNKHIVVTFHITVGQMRYFVWEEDPWSSYIAAIENDAETDYPGYATGILSAADPDGNNVTLVTSKARTYTIWLESASITFTIEVKILNEMIAPGLALSGVFSIVMIIFWLIKKEQFNI